MGAGVWTKVRARAAAREFAAALLRGLAIPAELEQNGMPVELRGAFMSELQAIARRIERNKWEAH